MSTTSAACAASLGALLFGLGLAVSLARTKASRFAGYPPESSAFLHKLVRAHGNTAEYAPFVALLILYLGTRTVPSWVEVAMIGTTAARFAIVLGLLWSSDIARPHPVRFIGALGTYVGGLALSWACVS